MRFLFLGVLVTAFSILATGQHTQIYPPIQLNFQELASYVNLTSAQLQSLKAIQQSKNEAQQAAVKSLTEKQQQLNALLETNGSDATQIGQLSIDLYKLRKQSGTALEPFHGQALGVLTPEQQGKLAELGHALELGNAASQAVMLSLLSPLPPRHP